MKNKGISGMRIGFDNDRYLKIQSEHIKERINQFGDKLYLEFGGKLFDDYHASRVLPGFAPDSKLQMLMQLADMAEIVIVISAADIEKNKVRGDLGITYDVDVVRLIGEFEKKGLYVGSVVITQFAGQSGAVQFREKLEKRGIKVYQHYKIEGYPANIPLIDKMVGKFTGQDVPACGFSIGFERIVLLLMESGFTVPMQRPKVAYLIEKGYPADKLVDVIAKAQEERQAGKQVLVVRMNKNKKFQKEKLAAEGYKDIVEFFNN